MCGLPGVVVIAIDGCTPKNYVSVSVKCNGSVGHDSIA